uniref:Protein V2 n=1 Tax=Pepper yellow leaf curl Indonesia virus TaxID=292477 RepID=Q5CCY1_9GEMI|nr:putative V2 protein [Pepper yellow leaf curl Indonesia virus]
MWDPLVHPFPNYTGFDACWRSSICKASRLRILLIRLEVNCVKDLICLLRCKNYAESFHRYSVVVANVYNTPETKLRESVQSPCCCPHCPSDVLQTKSMGKSAYVSETEILQGSKDS